MVPEPHIPIGDQKNIVGLLVVVEAGRISIYRVVGENSHGPICLRLRCKDTENTVASGDADPLALQLRNDIAATRLWGRVDSWERHVAVASTWLGEQRNAKLIARFHD